MKRKPREYFCERGCGDKWDHDPRLAVECPTCHAKAGTDCIRPSEHRLSSGFGNTVHAARCKAAWKANPCSCDRIWLEKHGVPCIICGKPAEPVAKVCDACLPYVVDTRVHALNA